MMLPMFSQTIFPRVQTLINSKGDTLIQLKLADAKIILGDLLHKQINDSIIKVYTIRDSVQKNTIYLQKTAIELITTKYNNELTINQNLSKVLENNDKEVKILNEIIKEQKKEIRKQKVLKIIGFTAAVILPITIILLMSH